MIGALALSFALSEPSLDLDAYRWRQQRTLLAGMSVLTGYAVANIGWGIAGRLATDGSTRYVHEMNAAWNGVNLTLGVVGLVRNRRPPEIGTIGEAAELQRRTLRIYAINGGLDVLYIGAGSLMFAFSSVRDGPQRDRLEGYGRSIMLQGAFLFAFDLAMLIAHERAERVSVVPAAGRGRGGVVLTGSF